MMSPTLATLVYALAIVLLVRLTRDSEATVSKALWIPTLWLLINGSRPVSAWLAMAGFGSSVAISSADQYLDGSPIDRAVFVVLLIAALVVLAGRKEQVKEILSRNKTLLLFFAYCALSVLWSDYPFVAFKRWNKGIGDVIMVLVVLTDLNRGAAIKRILTRVGFVLLPVSLLFIKYYPDWGREYNPWSWAVMYSGVTETKNELGMVCLVFGLGSAWCLLSAWQMSRGSERTRQLVAYLAVVLTAVWLLYMANSMTSLMCFGVAGALMALVMLFNRAQRLAVVNLMIAAIVSVCFSVLFLNAGGGILNSVGRDPTLTGRTSIWQVVLSVAGNPLVGTGYESFWLGERLSKVWAVMPGIQEAHNGYLEVYLNLGWIGVGLMVALIIAGYRNAVLAFRHDFQQGALNLAFFTAAVVYNFTEAGFRMMSPIWVAFLLAATAVPTDSESQTTTVPQAEDSLLMANDDVEADVFVAYSTIRNATAAGAML